MNDRMNDDRSPSERLVTVPEAAELLGISPEAVRARLNRGTLQREKGDDGTTYVRLDDDRTRTDDDRTGDRTQPDGDRTGARRFQDHALVEELVEDLAEELRQQVEFLKAELAARNEELRRREEEHREESRRKDHIIMSLTQRVPELEPAPEPPESPETATAGAEGVEAPLAEEQQQRPWWRRLFSP